MQKPAATRSDKHGFTSELVDHDRCDTRHIISTCAESALFLGMNDSIIISTSQDSEDSSTTW